MKNFVVSAGLVAIGAASVQTALADDAASPKLWSVSASLRGFYDDNYSTASTKKGSAGIEFSPSASYNVSLQQTDFGARYTYGLYWYEERQDLGQNALDQTHQLDLWLDHAFDERWKANVADTFAVGQEPELLEPGVGGKAVPTRTDGNNIANHFSAKLDTQWTRKFSTELHYGNDWYDYQNSGNNTNNPSLAALLNGVEQNAGIDLQWHFQPQTMGFVGYTADWTLYTASEVIGSSLPNGAGVPYFSQNRDLLQNQLHVGVQHQFTPNLGGSVSAGATYSDNYNDNTPGQSSTDWSPYANLTATYTYLPGCYIQGGFTHDINPTDVPTGGNGSGDLTLYQETSVVYLSLNHHITQKLVGSVIGQIAFSDYIGGASNEGTDIDYNFGVSLSYQINQYLSADAGYNYDNLQSDLPGRTYDRNRVYIGLTASY